MPETDPATRTVPTRRISFDEFDQIPRYFAQSENVILCHLTAMMSSMFPDGEDYFVRSVRHYRSQITDPDLKRQVTGFIGQESVHGREHRAFNMRLAELGYPTHRMEWLTKRSLTLRERVVPPIANLALTAALEHFTATLAELVLSDEASRAEFGHPAVRDLFLWHALEESEHKAVAFDVYRAVGGSERTRIWTMQFLRFGFVAWTSVAVTLSLLGDRATYRRGNLRRCWAEFKRSPLVQRDVWLTLRDYCRPDFHPDDHDNRELLEQWRETLFGDEGTLVGKLATPAA